jgi:glycosyltransferase involved in cell wall biosynthesis
MKKLSIIIPCYNEEKLIEKVLEKVLSVSLESEIQKEIIVVNDGSADNTAAVINAFCNSHPSVIAIHQQKNSGKGAAIRSALEKVSGEIIIIQDGDLEYDPGDYNKLLRPITGGYADVVYGSRFRGGEPHRVLFFFHTIGNRFLTFLSNLFTGLNLTDMETGYKMFRTEMLKQVRLKENRFGFEPEVTAKISRIKNIRIYEVGIAYYGRTYQDGKKINWRDGFHAIWCVFKYNIFSRK